MTTARPSDHPATSHETVDAIVESSRRPSFPLRRTFLQIKRGKRSTPGPLASFVFAGDGTALRLYFLVVTKASSAPWDVSLHSAVWARALGFRNPASPSARGRVSRAWRRLEERGLVVRQRRNRLSAVTLLREDGSGEPYERPTTGFFTVPHELWTGGPDTGGRWFEALSLPELTFLIIALSNADDFPLPVERGPDYYGISADTLLRGYGGLSRRGVLTVRKARITAPLAPDGVSFENRYTLREPFGPRGHVSRAASVPR